MEPVNAGAPTRRARTRRRRRANALTATIGIVGELLLTGGVLVLLFLGWQLWFNNQVAGNASQAEALAAQAAWDAAPPDLAKAVGSVPRSGVAPPLTDIPAFDGKPAHTEVFANLIVPRFGKHWIRTIGEGVDVAALAKGIGHYPDSQMPGALGNFAIASHRDIDGGAFHDIDLLRVGDPIYVETPDGWYLYRFRSHEVVPPTEVSVVAAVPHEPGLAPDGRYITFTTCNPKWSSIERIIGYGVFESFTPRADGPPAAIADVAGKGA